MPPHRPTNKPSADDGSPRGHWSFARLAWTSRRRRENEMAIRHDLRSLDDRRWSALDCDRIDRVCIQSKQEWRAGRQDDGNQRAREVNSIPGTRLPISAVWSRWGLKAKK